MTLRSSGNRLIDFKAWRSVVELIRGTLAWQNLRKPVRRNLSRKGEKRWCFPHILHFFALQKKKYSKTPKKLPVFNQDLIQDFRKFHHHLIPWNYHNSCSKDQGFHQPPGKICTSFWARPCSQNCWSEVGSFASFVRSVRRRFSWPRFVWFCLWFVLWRRPSVFGGRLVRSRIR